MGLTSCWTAPPGGPTLYLWIPDSREQSTHHHWWHSGGPPTQGALLGVACQLTCEGESQRVPRVSVPKHWPRRGNKHKLVPPPPPPTTPNRPTWTPPPTAPPEHCFLPRFLSVVLCAESPGPAWLSLQRQWMQPQNNTRHCRCPLLGLRRPSTERPKCGRRPFTVLWRFPSSSS